MNNQTSLSHQVSKLKKKTSKYPKVWGIGAKIHWKNNYCDLQITLTIEISMVFGVWDNEVWLYFFPPGNM